MKELGYLALLLMMMTVPHCRGELTLLQIVFHNRQHAPEKVDQYKFPWQNSPIKIGLIGMIHLFKLGQRLRQKYSDFVPTIPSEVDSFERGTPCSSLRECFLSGFYKPNKQQTVIQEQMTSQPPFAGRPDDLEQFADSADLKCLMDPRLREASSEIYDSEEGNKIIGEYTNLYEYWSINSGMEIRNPTDAQELYQNLELEKSLNLSIPSWADRFWPELKRQSEIHFFWLAKSQDMQKMASGSLLGLMIHRMQKYIEGQDHHRKYYVYSGKNSSLAGLLAIFGAYDGVEPLYGSTVVLELHRFGELYYVRVLYFYSSDRSLEAPEIVVIRSCSEYCPFKKFKRLITSAVPNNWEQQCEWLATKSTAPFQTAFRTIVILLFLYTIGYY